MKNNATKDCLIQERTVEFTDEHQSFSDFIKDKRKLELGSSGKKSMTTRELADRLDIDYEQFRKILNMNIPTKKRDCIIAICAALRLDSDDTNEALVLYRYMPTLDTDNPRDDLLIEILEEQLSNPLTIDQINQRLIRNGFPELDIIDHRPSVKPASGKKNMPYKLLKKQVRTFTDELFYGDQYDSLETEYDTFRYRCVADMWLDDEKNRLVYKLTSGATGGYYLEKHGKDIFDVKAYKDLAEAGDFQDYFLELSAMANHELKKMLATLNDTKNYKERIGAGIRDDAFYIFAETFNYLVPETGEYYLYEKIGSDVRLSVYKNSAFMRCYMSEQVYQNTFGKKDNELIVQYTSTDEIEHAIKTAKYYDVSLLRCRLKNFKHLSELAASLKQDIVDRRKYVRRLDYIYDDKDRVCQFFGVDKDFQCVLDDEYGDFMAATIDHVDFRLPDDSSITITLQDLYYAFELGFSNINEICRVKKKLGSIEEIVK